MPLTPGTTLGSYSVTAKIGEGGMGEVYRARDTKLDRDVALKVLPEAFTQDPDRLARFEREAKVLASLNHPNIGHIYGLEEAEGVRALVLELIEGPTLADRIAQGPIPVDEALPIAKQIAEALEAAHEAGVIHRDLKPANIKVRQDGTVKVLDFGLAKALDTTPEGDPSQSPTLTAAATQMGVILGTAAYMSPEQARGLPVDKRADVWAFGVVLYEMLTGSRPFQGEDVSLTLASVMKSDVNVTVLPTDLPETLRTVIRQCLQKDTKQRVADMQDVRLAMEGAFETTVSSAAEPTVAPQLHVWQRPVPLAILAAVLVVVTGLAVWSLTRPPVSPPSRFVVAAPADVVPNGHIRVSPDGRTVAFGGVRDGRSQVYLRSLGQLVASPVRGTEGTAPVAFSPDGQALLFGDVTAAGIFDQDSPLERVPLTGGPATTVADGHVGAAWGAGGTIVLGTFPGGLRLVGTIGGEPTPLTTLAEGEVAHIFPTFLPNGDAVLFSVFTGDMETGQVGVVDLETGQRTTLLPGTTPSFAPTGHLVFWRDGSLWAVPFDPDRLDVEGAPVVVVEGVGRLGNTDAATYALAANGTLVYLPGGAADTSTVGWVNREGEMTTPLFEGMNLANPRLSTDGSQVAFEQASAGIAAPDIWVRHLARGVDRRLTVSAANDIGPIWTPDDTSVTFGSDRDDPDTLNLYQRPVDLSAPAERVLDVTVHEDEQASPPEERDLNLGSWAPDGTLVYYHRHAAGDRDIWSLPPGGTPEVFLATTSSESAPRVSPNGRWLVYVSDQTGEYRVYVQAFPAGGAVHPISPGLGTEPVWSRDGRELFYRSGQQMTAVGVDTGPTFAAHGNELLFQWPYNPPRGGSVPNYDVSLDGQQFLMVQPTGAAGTAELTIVLDWFEELTRLVPTP